MAQKTPSSSEARVSKREERGDEVSISEIDNISEIVNDFAKEVKSECASEVVNQFMHEERKEAFGVLNVELVSDVCQADLLNGFDIELVSNAAQRDLIRERRVIDASDCEGDSESVVEG